jgi:uncharacterized protein YbjT (DUF2867 family)
MSKAILVTGATGKQGGSVVRALVAHPDFDPKTYSIYALTRNAASGGAKKLTALSPSIKIVQGDFKDIPGIFKSLPSKPWGVFAMTNVGKGEVEEGKALVDEAVKAGASHFVFSSVDRGGANDGMNLTNVPHFITKHKVEVHLKEVADKNNGKFSYTILRPVFFLDNLTPDFLGKMVSTMIRDNLGDAKIPYIDTTDIGVFAADAFFKSEDPTYHNKAHNLAGGSLTWKEMSEEFKKQTGRPIPTTFSFLGTIFLWLSHDFKMMFQFFKNPGFGADAAACNKVHPMTSFAQWLAKTDHVKNKSA